MYSNVDYFTLNISSPNTFGLRTLLDIDPLRYLLDSVQNQNHKNPITRPMVIKISPDMSNEQILGLIDICKDYGVSGVISNNTTINHNYDKGGLSGNPLTQSSSDNSYSQIDLDELEIMLEDAINAEDYIKAARIRDEIAKRK